jgi:hypothetical protein
MADRSPRPEFPRRVGTGGRLFVSVGVLTGVVLLMGSWSRHWAWRRGRAPGAASGTTQPDASHADTGETSGGTVRDPQRRKGR